MQRHDGLPVMTDDGHVHCVSNQGPGRH